MTNPVPTSPSSDRDATLLFCLPYAGGSSMAFRSWTGALPGCEVVTTDYPGHLLRPGERLVRSMDRMVDLLCGELADRWDHPFVLLGSSMGALVAFELARRAEAVGRPPAAVVLLSCAAPSLLPLLPPIAGLGDEAFLAAFTARYGGPVHHLLDDPASRDLLLPIVRADMELFEDYARSCPAPVSCDLIAIAGADDPVVTPDSARAWGDFSKGRVDSLTVPGGHFVVESNTAEVTAVLRPLLDRRLPAA
ncbi:thioesterase [Streptomyces sp. 130]|nr:thioesterase [Streptomyces sp. 130]